MKNSTSATWGGKTGTTRAISWLAIHVNHCPCNIGLESCVATFVSQGQVSPYHHVIFPDLPCLEALILQRKTPFMISPIALFRSHRNTFLSGFHRTLSIDPTLCVGRHRRMPPCTQNGNCGAGVRTQRRSECRVAEGSHR